MLPKVEDVTASTQQLVKGPVTAWQHKKTGGIFGWILDLLGLSSRREFIAAKSPSDDLLLFQRKSPVHSWGVDNLSQITNQQISSKVVAWSDKFLLFFPKGENIAGMNPIGDLVWFKRSWGNWSVTNISAITNQKITGPVVQWRSGSRIHFAGIGPGDELLVFSGSGSSWSVENLTNITNVHITGALTSWITRNGPYTVPHIAGITPNGDLIVFWLSTTNDWKHVDVSNITGHSLSEGLGSWQTWNGPYLVEHLAGRDPGGNLIVFWWSPQHDWQAVNVTRFTCEKIEGVPSVYQITDDDGQVAEVLSFPGKDNELFIHWWKPSTDWVPINLTDATGENAFSAPACWTSYSSRYHRDIEYVAVQGGDYRLLVFYYDTEPRDMVAHLVAPYEGLKRTRGVSEGLLVIFWDWLDPAHTPPNEIVLENTIFGAANSVNDYLRENSNSHFSIYKIDFRGKYNALNPYDYYQFRDEQDTDNDGVPDQFDLNQDGFVNQHHVKYKEAVQLAHEDGFPFANYDVDPQDGKLTMAELPIILVVPGSGGRGFVRHINETEYPNTVRYNINGLEFDALVEIYSPPNPTIGTYGHELGHIFLGHGDMYWEGLPSGTFMKYAPGAYSVMDQHGWPPHYDPFAKMKWGWASPRLILRSGVYDFPDIESNYKVWVLMDPTRSFDEYFLIENRWTAGTYEQGLPDKGLAVWHIIEDHQVYNSLPCPPGMDPVKWAEAQTGRQWARLGVRMIRPVITNFDDNRALWDGSDPATGYDLLSSDPDPDHSELRWADGSPSGFEIRQISPAGPVMTTTVNVPF